MKKIFSIFLCMVTIITGSVSVFATDNNFKINNVLKNYSSNEDYYNIYMANNEKLIADKFNKVEEILKNNELCIETGTTKEKIFNLGDNSKLKITLIDESEDESLIDLTASTPGGETLWKDYGNRKFTSHYEVWIGPLYYDLYLVNHYKLSASGITERYGESYMDVSGAASGRASNVNISKSSAGIGETVSMNCVFTLTQTTTAQYSKVFKMYNKVKCSSIDTVDKQVKVVQSWNGEWLS